MSERGTYIVIEGIDGTGKTELAARLVPPLLGRGHSISSYREPTDKFLRSEFARLRKLDPFAAALCYTVDRALLRPLIERALEMGRHRHPGPVVLLHARLPVPGAKPGSVARGRPYRTRGRD